MKPSSRSLVEFASVLLLTVIAVVTTFGQAAIESDQAAPEQRPAATQRRGEERGPTTVLEQPRYMIEAIDFRALDETGVDATGSDEIVARFSLDSISMFTGVYGSVDRGETHAFRARQRCIWPAIDPDKNRNQNWTCDAAGRPGPVSFDVTIYEHDGVLRQWLTGEWIFCSNPQTDLADNCNHSQLESAVVGRYRLFYSEDDLARTLPKPGMHSTNTILIDRCSEAVTVRNEICGYSPSMPDYAAYRVSIRITRQPNGGVAPPVVR